MKIAWIALGSLLTATLAVHASPPAAASIGPGATPQAAQTIRIRAWIDGRSQLILNDDTAQWQHFDFAAPGRLDCNIGEPIEPTYIDGVEWWPQWPDLPDCENRFCNGCFSDVLTGLVQGIPDVALLAHLVPVQVRGSCSVVEVPTQANGFRAVVEFDDNGPTGADWYEIDLVLEPWVGVPYCTSTPNSSGRAAHLNAAGSLGVQANDTYLRAFDCPGDCMGMFFYGSQKAQLPFGNGTLCVSPFNPGLFRLPKVVCSTSGGEAELHLDFPSLPLAGAITTGSTWNFQFWFRDPAAGGTRTNLSQGLELTFLP